LTNQNKRDAQADGSGGNEKADHCERSNPEDPPKSVDGTADSSHAERERKWREGSVGSIRDELLNELHRSC
jgi:hypothetical protein